MTAKDKDPDELNLCELLKGCEGMAIYSPMFGECVISQLCDYIVVSKNDANYVVFENNGKYCDDGECLLFPSKENRDWSTFKKPIKEGLPCMCKNSDSDIWVLRTERQASYTYCVPVDNFDFKDIENNISRSIV